MASIYGKKLKLSVFGESPGEAIGVVIAGFPAGIGEIPRVWLNHGCAESPEELADIIRREYHTTQRL